MMTKKEFRNKCHDIEDQLRDYLNNLEVAMTTKMFEEYGRNMECGMSDVKTDFRDLLESINCCIDQLDD